MRRSRRSAPPLAKRSSRMRVKARALPLSGPYSSLLLESGARENSGRRAASDEGAETRDGLADDQILHLICPFVGVERFAVREEARCFVVGDDTVAAEQLACPCNGLAALGGAERLGKRRMRVGQLAFGMQLRLTHNQA